MQRQPSSTWTFLTKMNSLMPGLISADDGSALSLPSDGGLAICGTEGKSEAAAKSSDGKSLTVR